MRNAKIEGRGSLTLPILFHHRGLCVSYSYRLEFLKKRIQVWILLSAEKEMQPLATHLLFHWSGILGSDGWLRASRSFPDSFEPKPCPLHFNLYRFGFWKKRKNKPCSCGTGLFKNKMRYSSFRLFFPYRPETDF